MNTQRLNITIPRKIMDQLKDKPNKSAFIAAAIAEKLASDLKKRQDRELGEAYRMAAIEDRKLIAEWDTLAVDGL